MENTSTSSTKILNSIYKLLNLMAILINNKFTYFFFISAFSLKYSCLHNNIIHINIIQARLKID